VIDAAAKLSRADGHTFSPHKQLGNSAIDAQQRPNLGKTPARFVDTPIGKAGAEHLNMRGSAWQLRFVLHFISHPLTRTV
jgi:hypothetical protein